ncbi:hypothetical protein HN51_005506 [Arachis hypogaea]
MILLGWVPMMKEKKEKKKKKKKKGFEDADDLVKVQVQGGAANDDDNDDLRNLVVRMGLEGWMVLFVEVRPNLLSGDADKFLLEDISQVGDVVLVPDESVIQNEFKMVGLETLVGYKVVTPSQRNIGKVCGYKFSLNSGAVEELELDSFGLSLSLQVCVTYRKAFKGFLGNQNVGVSMGDLEDYDSEPSVTYGQVSRRRKSLGRKKPNQRYWDLPMDYL